MANFTEVAAYRFPGDTYDAFKQLVIFRVKREFVGHVGFLPDVIGELKSRSCQLPNSSLQ